MESFHVVMAALTAIILFLFGLENFSREIQKIAGENFRKSLGQATRLPIVGLIIGALVTAIIQSSSATSVIAISLVNAGVLSFKSSVGIIFGSNIGTTVTAQLVAFKLTAFAPLIVISGFILSLLRSRFAVFGKAVFYFGFVLFSLNLISSALEPVKSSPAFVEFLSEPANPVYAVLIGCIFTALVQSSSVTTGLAIVLTQQGILGLENAVPLIIGANIGTTVTAMIAMFNMDAAAKKTAVSHLLFNVGGVVIFLPIVLFYSDRIAAIEMDPAIALANIHFIFNVVTSLIFIIFIGPFTRFIDMMMGEGKMDFDRLNVPKVNKEDEFENIKAQLSEESDNLLAFLQENYNLVTLSIETDYKGVYDAAGKRIDYIDFIEKEYMGYFSKVVHQVNDKSHTRDLIRLINQFDYLFQIHDSITDLYNSKTVMQQNYVELKSDILVLVREISSQTLILFDDLRKGFAGTKELDIQSASRNMQEHLDDAHGQLFRLLSDSTRRDVGALTNFVTYSQRLKDKLVNYARVKAKMN